MPKLLKIIVWFLLKPTIYILLFPLFFVNKATFFKKIGGRELSINYGESKIITLLRVTAASLVIAVLVETDISDDWYILPFWEVENNTHEQAKKILNAKS